LPFKLPQSPKPEKPERWWNLLNGSAKVANELTLEMLAHPTDAVPILRKNLLATPKFDEKVVAKLTKDIAEGDFQTRTAAAKKLGEYDVEAVSAAIRAALTPTLAQDVRDEFSRFLGDGPGIHTQHARRLRAIRALELIGSKEARKALEELAKRTDAPDLSRQASQAARRLAK
jgi:HEAT repeat protein